RTGIRRRECGVRGGLGCRTRSSSARRSGYRGRGRPPIGPGGRRSVVVRASGSPARTPRLVPVAASYRRLGMPARPVIRRRKGRQAMIGSLTYPSTEYDEPRLVVAGAASAAQEREPEEGEGQPLDLDLLVQYARE